MDKIEIKSNPIISKALQILNSAKNDNKLTCYLEALKITQKVLDISTR